MEETKKEFIKRLKMLVDFWENNEKCSNTRDRLDGITFSLLYLLDGNDNNIKDFTISTDKSLKNNISGNLCDLYFK